VTDLTHTPSPDHSNTVVLAHGGGGQLTDQLVAQSVLPRLTNDVLADLLDAAVVDAGPGRLALTIDGYVVQPLEFPGGDIGRLAISGTVNDLAVSGAAPAAIALGLILEEGLDRAVLDRVMDSIGRAADEAGVRVVTGDTKVVGRGQADGMYITTAGVGFVSGEPPHPGRVRAGDVLILNGPIADHGLAVMLAREMPEVRSVLRSDVAPLNRLIAKVLERTDGVRFMRDPTRSGVAGVVADLAERTGLRIVLEQEAVPLRPETNHAAEMLGLDPLEVANEGKVIIVADPAAAAEILAVLRDDPLGAGAAVVGRVEAADAPLAELHTAIGGRRIIQKPYGEQLPRIC